MKHDIFFEESTHTYVVDGQEVPSVTTILKPLTDRGYSVVNPSVLEYARNRGSAVHEALEVYDLGGELEVMPETEGYIRAYLEWCQVYRPKWEGIEQIVYNESEKYIGTLDRVGCLNGTEFAIVDLKTSTPTRESLTAVCVQTYAYLEAYRDSVAFKDAKRYGLFLKSDGTFRMLDCYEYEWKYSFVSSDIWQHLRLTNKLITEALTTKGRK